MATLEAGLADGRLNLEELFDNDYQMIAGTDPARFTTGFTDFADRHIRPILDRVKALDEALIGGILIDRNFYHPTHLTQYSQPHRDDPEWNEKYSRNRVISYCPRAERAMKQDAEFCLATNSPKVPYGSSMSVKSVFVPIRVAGRLWGVFELAYRQDLEDSRQLAA
jgi:methyl-accepting chemotaxis protein